ncbi:uncharacterized protein LOC135709437 [Ochlerotatus camptorhynchus]|uniref:uncharacterized protein LOC135709437 n=1 Tax=Ochlerotatus camptorhynchus TaxID=644619 RepID=UPI0031D91BF1
MVHARCFDYTSKFCFSCTVNMYFKRCEMDEAFDRFILSLAKRSANHSDFLYVLSGETLGKDVRNYVLALHRNKEHEVELSVAEYRVSIEDYQHVQSRDNDIKKITQNLPTQAPRAERSKRYLILANFHDEISVADAQIINQAVLERQNVLQYPQKLLNILRAARIDRKLGGSNIYEFFLNFKNSKKTVKQLLLTDCFEASTAPNAYYRLDPIVKNGICLMELYEDPQGADLGLFLIREATDNPLITHVQPARQLSEVTDATRFIVNYTVAFEDLCRLRTSGKCHEVIYREDYGLVYWMKSSGSTNKLRPFLSCGDTDSYERCVPPGHWLNVIYAERSAGKSAFLRFLEREFRRLKAFSVVRVVDGVKLDELSGLSLEDKLRKLCEVKTEKEFEALEVLMRRPEEVLLLFDAVDHIGNSVVEFFKELEEGFDGAVKVWIAADRKLQNLIENSFPVVSHEFPVLNEGEQAKCLKVMAPHLNEGQLEKALALARQQNAYEVDGYPINHSFTGNVFHLKLVAEVGLEDSQSKYQPDLLELFVQIHCISGNHEELEEKCYRMIAEGHYDAAVTRLCLHSTIVEYLAAKYLARRLELITLELYRKFRSLGNMLDRILVRNCNLARAVLNKDLEQVQANLEQRGTSFDTLRRTPLHLCHDALPIAEVLISASIDFEVRCLLSDCTPLQMADERHDWKLVDLLLKHGANASFPSLRLRLMPSNELVKVLDSCIAYNLSELTRWILTNRPDLRITQPIIYALSVYEEFNQELSDRILELAFDQDLPTREAPYRFMWGNTALHLAAHGNRLELCRFLVEKLKFDVDEEDYSGQTAIDEARDVAVVEFLRSRSARKSRKNMVSASEPDDRRESTQGSVFFRACYSDNLDLVRYAVEQEGHNPLEKERGSYGLIQAAAWGSFPIVQYLYEVGFHDHLDLEDDSQYTALATAVRYEHFEIVKFLVEKGADTGKIRDTPANRELLNFMIESFEFKPVVNFEALANLSLEDLREIALDFSTKDENGRIFLHYYVEYYSDPEILRFLLTKYDDIDLECQHTGRTALHEALISNHPQLVDVLLEAGADFRKRCSQTGRSVLHFAAAAINKRHMESFLTKSGLTIDDRDKDGQTIMFYLKTGSVETVRYLVDHYGMDVNARNNQGQSILHKTIIEPTYFYLHELEILLRDVEIRQNITDLQGRLALHYAVEQDQLKAVRLMGRYGYLELDLKDCSGKSPRMLAAELNRTEILQYFNSL